MKSVKKMECVENREFRKRRVRNMRSVESEKCGK